MKFENLSQRLKSALIEDQAFSDVTTHFLPEFSKHEVSATVIAKSPGVFCGSFIVLETLRLLDSRSHVKIHKSDGSIVRSGEKILSLKGTAKAILGAERTILNLICHLSGIATLTKKYVDAVRGSHVSILDTRKTTPLWRDLEKYAVHCAGGTNHRFSLGDAILVKDNHLEFLYQKKMTPLAVFSKEKTKHKKIKFLALEARNIKEVWNAIKCRADIVLLDNMDIPMIKKAVFFVEAARRALNSPYPLIEVSGGVTLEKARKLAKLGVDRISVGALTHSAPILDLSLEVL
ncbi:MAG: carboxylating nicotinate-nucleotide diphosphorylase [Elusimicrobiota bacterium]